MDFNQIKYSQNFIKQVICRIDFLEFLTLEDIIRADVVKSIRAFFPVTTMQQLVKFSNIGIVENTSSNIPPSAYLQTQDGILQEYFTHDKKNKLILSNAFFLIEFTQYNTFEEMCEMFEGALKLLSDKVKFTASRTGLRFINIFNHAEFAIKKTHLTPGVASALDAQKVKCESGYAPIRSMSLSEYRKDNMNINFRYGLFNNNYPNLAEGADFVLDYDCFTVDPLQDFNEIRRAITEAHTNIQGVFENSITDSLRKVLGNG